MSEKNNLAKRRSFDEGNDIAAAVILADTDRFGGEDSVMVQWARLYIARKERDERSQASSI